MAPVLGTSKNLLNTTTIPYKNNSNIKGNSFGKNVFTDLNGYRIPSKYFSYKNEGVIITNIDRVGESHCAGGLNISKGRMNGDVLCENISGQYYFYTKYSNFNMDPTNNILKFEIVDGTGPFLELVGQKCTAAYLPIQSDKYLFKGKCDIPDANFLRMKSFKD